MKSQSDNPTRTTYIQLDSKKCIACWECIPECKNNVIGRINLPWHKHTRIVNSNDCTGCLKCINVCESGALTNISNKEPGNNSLREKLKMSFIVNIGLLIFGLAMSISGFLIQFRYHMDHNSVLEIGYYNWTNIHKISIICISVLITYHIFMHWKWYKAIIIKKLAVKNKLQIILTLVFILVAITGYIPWIINLSGGSEIARKFFIEIHDKITILLFVLLTLHLTGRLKWYINTFDKLKNKHST